MLPQTLALPISVYHKFSKKSTIIKRDTADRINGLERPKPNEGYALTNGISNKSISQLLNFVNTIKKGKTEIRFAFLELVIRIELMTSSLPMTCSTD